MQTVSNISVSFKNISYGILFNTNRLRVTKGGVMMHKIVNLYEQSIQSDYRQFQYDKLLFVEYNCLTGNDRTAMVSHHNYIAYVVQGEKQWLTTGGGLLVKEGEALFIKKGVSYVADSVKQGVCILLFFIPDSFIHEVVTEFRDIYPVRLHGASEAPAFIQVNVDVVLSQYFNSVLSYFLVLSSPSPHLVKLKFKELLFQILLGENNKMLREYFLSLGVNKQTDIRHVMMENYMISLSLADYAKICNRSLTSFKRDFHKIFNISPGKWIINERLKYARMLLLAGNDPVTDIAFNSGFDTTSHFIRCFKKEFGIPPHQFRSRTNKEIMTGVNHQLDLKVS